jgi:4-hydroxy-3-polyprenylbenzoate decarboxylase
MKKIIIGISGASGAIYGIRLLDVLKNVDDIETHLITTESAALTIALETDYTVEQVKALADINYHIHNMAAAIASGSFKTEGMIVLPCSMKTLAGITYSFSDNLLLRAADVILKDRRRLVIAPRETPLHLGHLRMMTQVTEIGAIIAPPIPAFYHSPQSIDDIINQSVNRILDLVGIELEADLFKRWEGGRVSSR